MDTYHFLGYTITNFGEFEFHNFLFYVLFNLKFELETHLSQINDFFVDVNFKIRLKIVVISM